MANRQPDATRDANRRPDADRSYVTPRLIVFGRVSDVTRGTGGSAADPMLNHSKGM
jgi:hypothetical protein